MKTKARILAILAGVLASGSQAETIIEDSFTRTGAIDGALPDTGAAWSGSGWTTDDGWLSVSGSNATVISGLTFAPNRTYVLAMDVIVMAGGTGGGDDWIGFGFNSAGGNPALNSRGFMLRKMDPVVEMFSSGLSGAQSVALPSSPFPTRMEIHLTTGTTLTSSTLTYRLNSEVVGTVATTDASNIDSVFIQNIGGATGGVDNFVMYSDSDSFPGFTMDFVPIGNAGNVVDDTGYGAVGYEYRIATHEVSEEMLAFYNSNSSGPIITSSNRGITWKGSRAATNMSWNEAARFVNWLNTSQGFVEAYKFLSSGSDDNIALWTPADAGYDPTNPFRNQNACYFLPSEDEWYKAAYYDAEIQAYYDYATGSDSPPIPRAGNTTEEGTAIYSNNEAAWPTSIRHAGGLSPYGTMAQNGNVYEWCESAVTPPNDSAGENRVFRGGHADAQAELLHSSGRSGTWPVNHGLVVSGFRVASKPLQPEINVAQPLGNDLVSGVSVSAFGSVWSGSNPSSQTFTVCNYGKLPLENLTVNITGTNSGDFVVVANGLGTSLDPGECATITVEFSTEGKGTQEAVLEIGSNDSDEPVFTIDLTGEKVTPPPTDIELDPGSVEENQPAGTLVGTLTATDLDQADGFVFALVSGTGDDDNACFSIGGPNGDQLFTTKPFDTEGQRSYSILVEVTDADGQTYEEVFVIMVDDDCLEWWLEVEKVLALGRNSKHYNFGISVSVSGDTAIVGAPNANPLDDVTGYPGGAYVYQKVNGSWSRTQVLYASDRASLDDFGGAVCVDGNTVIVGAKENDDKGTAYIFERPDSNSPFVEVAKLDDNNGQVGDLFGSAVAVSGNTALVGASGDSSDRGAVHVFRRATASNWQRPQSQMVASDGAAGDQFGASLSLSGNSVLIGAPGDDTPAGGIDAGSAYLYTRSSVTSAFLQENILRANDGAEGDGFGISVSVSGDTAMVGAPMDDDPILGSNAGSVYVFKASGSWNQDQKIVADDAVTEGRFGFSVSLSGINAAIGSPFYNDGVTIGPGIGYIFRQGIGGGDFVQYQTHLIPSDGGSSDYFGGAVSLSGGNLLFGAPLDDDVMDLTLQQNDRGSAYFFDLVATTPFAPTGFVLKPVNPHAPFWGTFSSHFGHAEVEENKPVGTLVGTFSATHPYQVTGFQYELVPGPGGGDNGSFSIGGPEGNQLLTAEVFNYEVKGLYRVRVRVTECTGLTYERAMDVHIGDVLIEFNTYWGTIGDAGLLDATRLPQADPYKRGIPNGLAYALAIPLTGALTGEQRARLPSGKTVSGSGPTMEFVRPENVAGDVTYKIQILKAPADGGIEAVFQEFGTMSANENWAGEGAGNIVEMPAVNGFVRVCVEFPPSVEKRGLMRLAVGISE